MAYWKGTIVMSAEADIPMLRYIRNCRFVTHRQLFELLRAGSVLSARSSFSWRLERLLHAGYIERLAHTTFQGSPIYTITHNGLLELESHGCYAVALHSMTRKMPHPLQLYHALELTSIRVALAAKGLLVSWQSEIEITSMNLISTSPYQKDYDAIVDIWVGSDVRRFALEYERTLKSRKKYEDIKAAIERDREIPCVLFVAAHPDIMRALFEELTPSSKPMGFAVAKPFRELLLRTVLLTAENKPITGEEFLRFAHPLFIQSP